MSAESPPDTSERARSLKREAGQQSKRAVCFETARDDGERVRLAKDIDPSYADSITVSAPDGRAYDDAPPELPLAGSGTENDDCGDEIPLCYCRDCGSPTWVGSTCRRSRCPRCWEAWCFYRAISAVTKISGTRRKRAAEGGTNPYNHHAVVSFPDGTRFNSDDALGRLFETGKTLLGHVDADTGMLVYHPYRIAEEHRGDVIGHSSGSGDLRWKDILGMPADERDEYLVFSPHLHVFAVTDFFQGGEVTRSIEKQTGVVIERIADDDGVSLGDLDALCRAVTYSLSHAGLEYNETDDSYQAAYRYFGETANIERRANVRAEVEETMRRVAFDVLGVDFSRDGCTEEVVTEDTADDTPASVRVLSPEDNDDGSRSGSGELPESGSEWQSGNTGGFAADSSSPDARGMPVVSPDTDDDHDHAETETCGGSQAPIWTADERLADDEWRESIGEQTAEELRDAYNEWCELGKPKPEEIPPG